MKLREKSLSEESKEMFDRLPTKFMERLIVLLFKMLQHLIFTKVKISLKIKNQLQ